MFFSTRSTAFLLSAAFLATSVHANVKAVQPVKSSYEVNTPREYAKYWNAAETSDSVNPCLFGSIVAPGAETPVKYLYPSGYDVTWVGGYLSLQQYLEWKSSGIDSNKLIDNMAMAVGFPPNYTYNAIARPPAKYAAKPYYRYTGEWDLYVFDGCKAAKRGNAPQVPTPAFWLNRLKSLYGVDVSQVDYNVLTGDFWNVDAYTGCSDVACMGAADFNGGQTCGCNQAFLDALDTFGAADPGNSSPTKRIKNDVNSTANCYDQLSDTPDASELRAALLVCEAAGAWNTGNGVGWNFAGIGTTFPGSPMDAAEVAASPLFGMTFPEFVLENEPIKKLRAVRMSIGDCNGAPPPFAT